MEKLSVLIPVYNSEGTIAEVVKRIQSVVVNLDKKYEYEIILINDYSKDNTLDVCRELCENNKNIRLISFSKNFGQHHALMAGFKNAIGDYIICLDDDLQTPPEEINKLINCLEEGNYDVVYARYNIKNHSKFRNFGSYINGVMATHLINKPKDIYLGSFFICRKFIVEEIKKYDNPYPYIGGLIFRATQNIGSVVVEHRERKTGKSNYNISKLLSLWFNGFTNFSVKPLRISSLLGILLSCISFIFMIIVLIRKLINPEIQMGWTSLMVGIVFFGGIQLISIGLLGEYIGRIFLCINKSPQFVIKESMNLENKGQGNGESNEK